MDARERMNLAGVVYYGLPVVRTMKLSSAANPPMVARLASKFFAELGEIAFLLARCLRID